MNTKIKIWIRAIRAPFFTATIASVALGAVVAWHDTGKLHWVYFTLTILGTILVNSGTNLINDYFDHISNLDEINENHNQFSGGSRVIQEKLLTPRSILFAGLFSLLLAIVIGLYLNYKSSGNVILIIGIIGIFSGYFYTAKPFKLGYTPLGEIITGFGCGPLIVFGSYYVQTQKLSWQPLLISIPVGILVGLILFINEFPDYKADKAVGKKTMVVTLGKKKAISLYYSFLLITYLWVIAGVIFHIFPLLTLVIMITLPLSIKIIKIAKKNYKKISELLPANAATIGLHLTFGLLLSGSYLLDGLIK